MKFDFISFLFFHSFTHSLDLLNIVPVRNITSRKRWFDLDHSRPFIDRRRDQQLSSNAKRFSRCQHGSRHGMVRSLLLSLRKNVPTGTTRQRHDGRSGTAEVRTTRTGLFGRFNHGIQVLVQLVPALRLMQLVLDAILQIVKVSRKEGVDQECDAADIEGGFFASDSFCQHASGVRSFANKVGNEHDKLHARGDGDAFREPSRTIVNAQLDSSVNGGCDIVWVALCERRNVGVIAMVVRHN
jgi:hypothetical protein